jgi:thiol-disulfide isomerase/thioredoxin
METKYREEQSKHQDPDTINENTLSDMRDLKNKLNENDIFLRIHARWCGHCKHLSPIWNKLVNEIEKNKSVFKGLLLESIEDNNLKDNDDKFKFPELMDYVKGFPTLLYIKKGTFNDYNDSKQVIYEYKGSRDNVQDFINFIKEQLYEKKQMKTNSKSIKTKYGKKTIHMSGGGKSKYKRKTNKGKYKNKGKLIRFKKKNKSKSKSKKNTRKK